MKTFFQLLTPALVVTATNFVWFALVFWGFLATKSVISTSSMHACCSQRTRDLADARRGTKRLRYMNAKYLIR